MKNAKDPRTRLENVGTPAEEPFNPFTHLFWKSERQTMKMTTSLNKHSCQSFPLEGKR